ncbi:Raffinose permease [Yersinia intermedia ATCC 29909]|nr:Raffinose permease [Yersinia intermedia ATCC 29909]
MVNALLMFCAPWIINRIGSKNALLMAGKSLTAPTTLTDVGL